MIAHMNERKANSRQMIRTPTSRQDSLKNVTAAQIAGGHQGKQSA
jgi:hypothetical protein